jgi:hypothetical protein
MSGMEGLGRLFNIVPTASGVALNMSNCSAITFVGTNDNTFTLTIATSFAGTYRAYSFFTPNWVPIKQYYDNSDNGVGTGVWVKHTQTAASTVVQATVDAMTCFTLLGSQVPDTYDYVKCTASAPGDGVLIAILHDLTVQRTPPNLPAISA